MSLLLVYKWIQPSSTRSPCALPLTIASHPTTSWRFGDFYLCFFLNFCYIAAPLHALTHTDVDVVPGLSNPCSLAWFHSLLRAFSKAPVLSHFDFSKPCVSQMIVLVFLSLLSFLSLIPVGSFILYLFSLKNLLLLKVFSLSTIKNSGSLSMLPKDGVLGWLALLSLWHFIWITPISDIS